MSEIVLLDFNAASRQILLEPKDYLMPYPGRRISQAGENRSSKPLASA